LAGDAVKTVLSVGVVVDRVGGVVGGLVMFSLGVRPVGVGSAVGAPGDGVEVAGSGRTGAT
jgi:hypothetical protein